MVIHLASDLDPDEAQEWLDSVDALVAALGVHRARLVLGQVLERARGVASTSTRRS